MRQTAKLQYHYYHPNEFDFPLVLCKTLDDTIPMESDETRAQS